MIQKTTLAVFVTLGLAACGPQTESSNTAAVSTSTPTQSPVVQTTPTNANENATDPTMQESAEPAEALRVDTLYEVAALYHAINPQRPVQYEVLTRQLRLPYSSDPNEAERIKAEAKQNVDNELKALPSDRLRYMELSLQPTPIYNKELGGIPVDVPEILYISDSSYKFEVVNKKRFTFIALPTPEEVEKADAMGFNKRKNPYVNMQVTFKVTDKKSSGLAASNDNRLFVELQSIEFLTQKDIPIFTFKGL